MARHKGKPSGINKPEESTGIPSNFTPERIKRDHLITRKYTDHDEKLADHVRTRHPNRNVDKKEPTNGGGYKN
jgi:hypothetical protein